MDHDNYSDAYIDGILRQVKTIAMVGASANIMRPSYFVLKYLIDKGFEVLPVNPGQVGKTICGAKVYGHLGDLPAAPDMIDIFRNSEAAGAVVDEAIAIGATVIWMQLGVRNDAAAKRAEAAGLKVVMNRCPKIEYGRLSGEIGWMGVNSKTLSAKRPVRKQGFQHLALRPLKTEDVKTDQENE